MDRHPSLPPLHPGELSKAQVAIAELLGISRQTLIDILHERQAVTSEMAVRLGRAGQWGRVLVQVPMICTRHGRMWMSPTSPHWKAA